MTAALLLQSPPNPALSFLPVVLIFAIFYLLVFLPMQRQKKATQKMLSELQSGSVVVTSGGIIGTIVSVSDDDTLVVRVKPDGVKLQIARSSVSSLMGAKESK